MTPGVAIAVKVGWLCALACAAAGYVAFVSPLQAEIAELDARSDALAARVTAATRAAEQAVRLESLERTMATELAGIRVGGDRTAVVAEFLRDLAERAAARSVRLVSVHNTAASDVVAAPAGEPFEAASLDLVLEGRYAAVLRTLADISRARVLVKVDAGSVERVRGAPDEGPPALSVQLKVTVFSIHPLHLRGGDDGPDSAT